MSTTPLIVKSISAATNAECKLVKHDELEDHIMFIGEAVYISADEIMQPLFYHNGKYRKLGQSTISL